MCFLAYKTEPSSVQERIRWTSHCSGPSGHRRNLPFSSSAETVILAVLAVVPITLVGPNTAVFGIIYDIYMGL